MGRFVGRFVGRFMVRFVGRFMVRFVGRVKVRFVGRFVVRAGILDDWPLAVLASSYTSRIPCRVWRGTRRVE